MYTCKVFYYDKNCMMTHFEIMNIPGFEDRAVMEFVKEHASPDNLGTPTAYAVVTCSNFVPVLVRW